MSKFFTLCSLLAALCLPSTALAQNGIPTEEQAPIALMVDVTSGQTLFARDANRRFIPASMTKVMTALVAFKMLEERRITARQSFVNDPETFEEWHGKGSTMFLPLNSRVSVDQLLMGITTVSANDASILLAKNAAGSVDNWITEMNSASRQIGMRNSHFGTPNGWPDEGRTFTTARDLELLAVILIRDYPELYGRYFGHSGLAYNGVAQANHDPTLSVVPGADGLKTGFTNQAGYGFLGSGQRDGRRVVMVVAGSPSESVRAQASRAFLEWGLSQFEVKRAFGKGEIIGSAPVQDGDNSRVNLIAPDDIYVTVPIGENPEIKFSVRYAGPVKAPFDTETAVARLRIEVAGLPISSTPLVSDVPVQRAGIFRRLYNGLSELF